MSCDKEIHINDVESLFRVRIVDDDETTSIDISTATIKKFKFLKPDGTILVVDAEFLTNGSDGFLIYETVESDLNVVGIWILQGYVEFASGRKYHTSIAEFKVKENVE